MPDATVLPILNYPDVRTAVKWLERAFGFRERLRIGDHRAQMSFGAGGLVVGEGFHPEGVRPSQAVMVRVVGIEAHHARAVAAGARVVSPITRYPYGERQYTVLDPTGHVWMFSETVEDTDPASWGGELCDDANSSRT